MARTKYILVDRGEGYHLTAVTKTVLDDMQQRGLVVSSRPITQAEIKRDRVHIYDDSAYFEHKAFDAFKAKYHGKTFTAHVAWFNPDEGMGFVDVDNMRLPIYACNIAGKKTWYPETACVYYEAGQIVDVKIDVYIGATFVLGLTPGTVDVEKWDRIKEQNLAFRCDESGEPVTGLFI